MPRRRVQRFVRLNVPLSGSGHEAGEKLPWTVLPERSPSAPEIPTVRESGIPELKDFSLESYYGFMAPPGTPAAIASKIEADVLKVAAQPELRKKLDAAGMDMLVLNAAAMTRLIRADLEKYSKAAKAANIKACVCFECRWSSQVQATKATIDAGLVGSLLVARRHRDGIAEDRDAVERCWHQGPPRLLPRL